MLIGDYSSNRLDEQDLVMAMSHKSRRRRRSQASIWPFFTSS